MSKPVLYWTIQRRMFGEYVALGVTSEGPRRRINGRYVDGATTHTTTHDITGRFETEAQALAKVDEVKAIRKRFANLRKPLDEEVSRLHSQEQSAIKDALA